MCRDKEEKKTKNKKNIIARFRCGINYRMNAITCQRKTKKCVECVEKEVRCMSTSKIVRKKKIKDREARSR